VTRPANPNQQAPSSVPFARIVTVLLLIIGSWAGPAIADDGAASSTIGGVPPDEALRRGERLYRDGLLPSGEPIEGVVQGDIPINGQMFSCSSCHLRSGIGTIEGGVVTLPTNGEWLFKPMEGADMPASVRDKVNVQLQGRLQRPAYTDETLARVLRTGEDPAGRSLGLAMPRYRIEDDVMAQFIYYLRNLSSAPAPGVTDSELRFATVIADDVASDLGNAVFQALQAHVRDRNSQTRRQQQRSTSAPFYRYESYTSYRTLILDRWNLTGPRSTWRAQLEAYQREHPAFALLGGISGGDWTPIHQFCEENRIPNILPLTRLPHISSTDWYSLYFSKGWYQEGETVARYIRSLPDDVAALPVVQVFRSTDEGRMLAQGVRETRALLEQPPPAEKALDPDSTLGDAQWKDLIGANGRSIYIFWVGAEDLEVLDRIAASDTPPEMIFLSAELLGRRFDGIPAALRGRSYLTYPYTLPQESKRIQLVARQWLRARNVRIEDDHLNSQLYFIGWVLSGVIKKMGADFYRDRFLDIFDMMRDEYYSIGCYPRVSFGPGQRYASKGCYIAQASDDEAPVLIPKSGWVVH